MWWHGDLSEDKRYVALAELVAFGCNMQAATFGYFGYLRCLLILCLSFVELEGVKRRAAICRFAVQAWAKPLNTNMCHAGAIPALGPEAP